MFEKVWSNMTFVSSCKQRYHEYIDLIRAKLVLSKCSIIVILCQTLYFFIVLITMINEFLSFGNYYYCFISNDFFTPAVGNGFSVMSEWQQVSSSLQDSSQYSFFRQYLFYLFLRVAWSDLFVVVLLGSFLTDEFLYVSLSLVVSLVVVVSLFVLVLFPIQVLYFCLDSLGVYLFYHWHVLLLYRLTRSVCWCPLEYLAILYLFFGL